MFTILTSDVNMALNWPVRGILIGFLTIQSLAHNYNWYNNVIPEPVAQNP